MSRFFDLGISITWFFGLGVLKFWYMCLHGLVSVLIVKIEKMTQNYFNYIAEEYFNYPNLCITICIMYAEANWNNKYNSIVYNPGQNIWNKMEQFSKTGQEKESLVSVFVCFLTAIRKV